MRFLGIVCCLTILLAPLSALADCVDADLMGTWQFYMMQKGSAPFGATVCRIAVRANGSIRGKCQVEQFDDISGDSRIFGISLSVGQNCEVAGVLERSLGASGRGPKCRHTITHARMSEDQFTMSGVGTVTGKPRGCRDEIFQFTAIKR